MASVIDSTTLPSLGIITESYLKYLSQFKPNPNQYPENTTIFVSGLSTIVAICSFLFFIPFFANIDLNLTSNDQIQSTLTDNLNVRLTSAIGLGTCIPFLLELFISHPMTSYYYSIRAGILLINIIPFTLITFQITFHHFELFFICMQISMYCLFLGAFIIIIQHHSHQHNKISNWFTLIFLIFSVLTCAFELSLACFYTPSIHLLALTCTFLTFIGLCICYTTYFVSKSTYFVYKKSKQPLYTFILNYKYIDHTISISSTYIMCILYIIRIIYIINYTNGIRSMSPELYITDTIIRCCVLAFFSMCPSKLLARRAIHVHNDQHNKVSIARFLSHELRTPLNVIVMGLNLIEAKLKSVNIDTRIKRLLKEIRSSSTRASIIMSDFMDIELIRKKTIELKFTLISLDYILCETIKQFKTVSNMSGVNLQLSNDCFTEYSMIYEDVRMAKFIVNADKMRLMHAIGSFIYYTINSAARKECIIINATTITITNLHNSSDNVPGVRISFICSVNRLSIEAKETLLNDDFEFSNNANASTGLGIWIAKNIIELHGGNIGIEYGENMIGVTFYIDLPIVEIPTLPSNDMIKPSLTDNYHHFHDVEQSMSMPIDVVTVSPEPPPPVRLNSNLSYDNGGTTSPVQQRIPPTTYFPLRVRNSEARIGEESGNVQPSTGFWGDFEPVVGEDIVSCLHILVVDDSTLNLKMMTRVVKSLGHTCVEASDGTEAVTLFRERLREFDVILMDNSMPAMNGSEAAFRIRGLGYKGVILGITGNDFQADIDEYIRCGADLVIIKPLDASKFEEALRSVCNGGFSPTV